MKFLINSCVINCIDVNTTSGVVRGQTIHAKNSVLDTIVDQFLGIPYAIPPIGSLRFAKPQPIETPHKYIIDATKPSNSCMQITYPNQQLIVSEDCLYLNIWSTKHKNTNKLKPVMFWIHGGGLTTGSIFENFYNGTALASNDVVVVSTNYRLGVLGYLFGDRKDAPGNVGFFDQLLALKWVRNNIHKFGGDKDLITIFGESAGSWSVSAHILSPLSKGLFKRAIMQSGAHMYNKDRDPISKSDGLSLAKQIALDFNCIITETCYNHNWIQCLRNVSAKELIKKVARFDLTYPVVGTEFLPLTARQAFEHNLFNSDIDVIAGITKDEGQSNPDVRGLNITYDRFKLNVKIIDNIFHNIDIDKVSEFYLKNINKTSQPAVKRAFGEFLGDILMKCPTYEFAKQVAKRLTITGRNVYFYDLTYASPYFSDLFQCDTKTHEVCHCQDLPFPFGLPLLEPELYSPTDILFSRKIMKLWSDFAKTGNGDNNWPKLWSNNTPNVWHIRDLNPNNVTKIIDNLFDQSCDGFWKNYFIYNAIAINCIDINTTSGVVRGQTLHVKNLVLDVTVDQYLGIPYAIPPISDLRFAKPLPIKTPHKEIIDATKQPKSCMQLPSLLTPPDFMSEDCLYLNIWSSKQNNLNELKPVMFWIYGGGLSSGSINIPLYNGTALASNDVVVVATNYRLGIIGFLFGDRKDAPGNVGFFDQLLALKWVRDNIHKFGGDKDKITIFGESAGSWSVSAHILSPLSKGLFKRAIMESGAHMYNKERDPLNKTESLNNAKKIANKFNCTNDWIQCLRNVDSKELVKILPEMSLTFPVVGTEFLPLTARQAFEHNLFNSDIDLIAGLTKDEGQGFIDKINVTIDTFKSNIKPYDNVFHNLNADSITEFYLKNVNKTSQPAVQHAFGDFVGDILIKCPTYHFAKQVAKQLSNTTRNVYFYELTYANLFISSLIGCKSGDVCHGLDLDFVFGLPLLIPEYHKPKDIFFAQQIMKMWTDFAKTGLLDNNWPKLWTNSTPNVWHIRDLNPNYDTKTFDHLFDQTCDGFWKNYF
ncbi:acetylcholinesterase-like [Oppia nitens]|uniref:acetylcholinesterase-like n=1 Tax=Oppia nitens TaxID=1686743 RepID=UPI0023DA4389|nr:acetylcholinesterase-like [Oppia nitens]